MMISRRIFKERHGQSIVEMLVAITLITVGLLGVLALTTQALSEERDVANNFRGSYLATEGIEIARNILDGNYLNHQPWNCTSGSGKFCAFVEGNFELDYMSTDLSKACTSVDKLFFDATTGLYSYGAGGILTPFTRCVTIAAISPSEIQVNSVVTWNSRGGQSVVNVEDHFFNWRPK